MISEIPVVAMTPRKVTLETKTCATNAADSTKSELSIKYLYGSIDVEHDVSPIKDKLTTPVPYGHYISTYESIHCCINRNTYAHGH